MGCSGGCGGWVRLTDLKGQAVAVNLGVASDMSPCRDGGTRIYFPTAAEEAYRIDVREGIEEVLGLCVGGPS